MVIEQLIGYVFLAKEREKLGVAGANKALLYLLGLHLGMFEIAKQLGLDRIRTGDRLADAGRTEVEG